MQARQVAAGPVAKSEDVMQTLFAVLFIVSMFVPPAAIAVGVAVLAARAVLERRPRTGRVALGGHALASGRH